MNRGLTLRAVYRNASTAFLVVYRNASTAFLVVYQNASTAFLVVYRNASTAFLVAWLVACAAEPSPALEQNERVCTASGPSRTLPALPEASGLTLSRRTPGTLWSHNDSGSPVLFALNASGDVQGRVQVPNAAVDDWEDISAAPCPGGSCLYIADVGDNNTARRTITIYRVPEPPPGDGRSAAAEALVARYPDGAHDAEAVFVTHDSNIFLITKDEGATLYRFPPGASERPSSPATLEKVADLPMKRVTDADLSVDGNWVAVRSNQAVAFYRTADLVRGMADGPTMPLTSLKEPQGEGVALASDGTLYLVSEGSGSGRFSVMRCNLPK
jgi:hypothetical protein